MKSQEKLQMDPDAMFVARLSWTCDQDHRHVVWMVSDHDDMSWQLAEWLSSRVEEGDGLEVALHRADHTFRPWGAPPVRRAERT